MNTPIVGALRVAVIAEGAGEGSTGFMPPQPGDALWEALFGPVHVLLQRLIAQVTSAAIMFVQPPRTRGRLAVGSDLIHRKTLRQLLTWGLVTPPHLTVVVVDRDGEVDRPSILTEHVQGIAHPHVIGIAVEAFESWLAIEEPNPEALSAADIKQRVSRERDQRLATASTMDLPKHLARCPSLADLHEKLKGIIPAVLAGR